MVGWFDWLVSWLVGWLVSWLVGWLAGQGAYLRMEAIQALDGVGGYPLFASTRLGWKCNLQLKLIGWLVGYWLIGWLATGYWLVGW